MQDTNPNAEVINDLAKLVMHRIIARRLREDPNLMNDVQPAMDAMAERFYERTFVPEWRDLLALPTPHLARLLIERSDRMDRLRLSSPFMMVERLGLHDVPFRRRVWRLARRLAMRRLESEVTCEASPSLAA